MEVFEFREGFSKMVAKLTKYGGVYVDMPTRWGDRGNEFRETIVLENRGWRFTSLDNYSDYYFHVWLTDDNHLFWVNDMCNGIQYMREPFNPDYPNAYLINDTAITLYNVSQKIKEYQKRNIPTQEIFELRKLYLKVALKMLGYDSIDAVGEKLDDSRGYLGLTTLVDGLENYLDLSQLVYSLGKAGDEDMFKSRILESVTREEVIEYIKPVKDQIDGYVKFMQTRGDGLTEKRSFLPEYKMKMSEKVGQKVWGRYEENVKALALLLLELNADLLTEEQRAKYGLKEFVVISDIDIEHKISSVIDTVDFNEACKIEDEIAFKSSEELVGKIRSEKVEGSLVKEELSREDIIKLLKSELIELEERKCSVENQDKIQRDYYGGKNTKQKVKALEDEYVY